MSFFYNKKEIVGSLIDLQAQWDLRGKESNSLSVSSHVIRYSHFYYIVQCSLV